MTWQPIETCPEKVDVLFYEPYQGSAMMMVGQIERYTRRLDGEIIITYNPSHCSGYSMECDIDHPTHWMPLPEPPR